MRKLFKKRKLFKGGNYMRKYGIYYLHGRRHNKIYLLSIFSLHDILLTNLVAFYFFFIGDGHFMIVVLHDDY